MSIRAANFSSFCAWFNCGIRVTDRIDRWQRNFAAKPDGEKFSSDPQRVTMSTTKNGPFVDRHIARFSGEVTENNGRLNFGWIIPQGTLEIVESYQTWKFVQLPLLAILTSVSSSEVYCSLIRECTLRFPFSRPVTPLTTTFVELHVGTVETAHRIL